MTGDGVLPRLPRVGQGAVLHAVDDFQHHEPLPGPASRTHVSRNLIRISFQPRTHAPKRGEITLGVQTGHVSCRRLTNQRQTPHEPKAARVEPRVEARDHPRLTNHSPLTNFLASTHQRRHFSTHEWKLLTIALPRSVTLRYGSAAHPLRYIIVTLHYLSWRCVPGFGFRVSGFGFRVSGFGFS